MAKSAGALNESADKDTEGTAPVDEQERKPVNAGETTEDRRMVAAGEDADDTDDADNEEGLTAEEQDARREANRARRKAKKERHRLRATQERQELDDLRRENADLSRRLSNVENVGHQSQIAQIDGRIVDAKNYLAKARGIRKDLLASDDPAERSKVDDVDEAIYKARRAIDTLESYKKHAERVANEPPAIDQTVVSMAQRWAAAHDWYDPSGGDDDSAMMQTLDSRVKQAGYDPRTPEYWRQLDTLGAKYLPHRYNGGRDNDDDESDGERRRPPIIVGSGGRSGAGASGSTNGFKLSAARREALREAGYAEGSAEWKRMVDRYKAQDTETARGV